MNARRTSTAKPSNLAGVPQATSSQSTRRTLDDRDILQSVANALHQLGVKVVPVDRAQPRDLAIEWRGTPVAYAQPPSIEDLFHCAVRRVEARIGMRLSEVASADRLNVVRLLCDEGVFEVRGSVSRIARHFGVCNTTVYGALNRLAPSTGGNRQR